MAVFPEKSGNVYVCADVSESSTPATLGANSNRRRTRSPARPQRQEIAAGMAVDTQLEAWTTRVHAKVDLGGPAGALCSKEH